MRDALASVLSQSYPVSEIIIVDDASTDGTSEQVRALTDARMRVIRLERNQGPAVARNVGAKAATSEFLAFIDADDKWMPNHVETLIDAFLSRPSLGLVFSRKQNFGDDSGVWPLISSIPTEPDASLRCLMRNILVTGSTMVATRSAFMQAGGFPIRHRTVGGRRIQIEDFLLALTMAANSSVVGIPEITVLYRVHAQQSSTMDLWQEYCAICERIRMLQLLQRSSPEMSDGTLMRSCVGCAYTELLQKTWLRGDCGSLLRFACLGIRHAWLRRSALYYIPRALLRWKTLRHV